MGEAEELPDNVIVLRADDGSTEVVADTPENREKQEKTAGQRRAEFLFDKDGAMARAATLPRLLTGPLSAGVVNLMLVQIMQGKLKPATAKEAADIAKITHAIFRDASGASHGNLNLTPTERTERLAEIDKLQTELAHRAALATVELGGALEGDEEPPEPEPAEPDEWEHEAPSVSTPE